MDGLMRVLGGTIIVAFWMVMGLTAVAFYQGFVAEKFSLRKDEWTCTASHQQWAGKFYQTVCDQWSRK